MSVTVAPLDVGHPPVPEEALPDYSPRIPASRQSSHSSRVQTGHVYHLTNRHNAPWLTLKVSSHSRSAQSLPLFVKEDTIVGSVDLNLAKTDHIQAVTVTIWGQVMPLDKPNRIFWKVVHTLWSTSMGDPSGTSIDYTGPPWSPKLKGVYSWPFSFKLPATIVLTSKNQVSSDVPLPQTHNGISQISYRLEATIERGRVRVDSKVGTNFGYMPRCRAAQSSFLRQLAYQEQTPLLGPSIDPDGWHHLSPVALRGELFNARTVEVIWKLAMATPLEFARGSIIPLSLDLRSDDIQALDLLSKPSCPLVGLIKREFWDIDDQNVIGSSTYSNAVDNMMKMPVGIAAPMKENSIACVAIATWWLPEDSSANSKFERRLEGEIHLPTSLIPSFEFWRVGVHYGVHLLLPYITGFTVQESGIPSMAAQLVKITTDRAVGPVPRSYTPPGYDDGTTEKRLKDVSRILTSVVNQNGYF